MQLSNRQIMGIWERVKNDRSVTLKVTTAVREILKVFVVYNPTVGFLVYPHDGGKPEFKENFSDFDATACKYFVPLMAKPRTDSMVAAPRDIGAKATGEFGGESIIMALDKIVKEDTEQAEAA